MCKWGTTTMVKVPVPSDLSHTGEERWDDKPIDSCIADLVQALNEAGIKTRASCCGHGKAFATILLADGRELVVTGGGVLPIVGEKLHDFPEWAPARLTRRAAYVLANYAIDSKEKLLALDVDATCPRWKNCGTKMMEQFKAAQRALSRDDADSGSGEDNG